MTCQPWWVFIPTCELNFKVPPTPWKVRPWMLLLYFLDLFSFSFTRLKFEEFVFGQGF